MEERATAILRTTSADAARQAMEAAVEGGRDLEFTLTTPNALGLIEEFARRSGLIVGAGTVLLPEEALPPSTRGPLSSCLPSSTKS